MKQPHINGFRRTTFGIFHKGIKVQEVALPLTGHIRTNLTDGASDRLGKTTIPQIRAEYIEEELVIPSI